MVNGLQPKWSQTLDETCVIAVALHDQAINMEACTHPLRFA